MKTRTILTIAFASLFGVNVALAYLGPPYQGTPYTQDNTTDCPGSCTWQSCTPTLCTGASGPCQPSQNCGDSHSGRCAQLQGTYYCSVL